MAMHARLAPNNTRNTNQKNVEGEFVGLGSKKSVYSRSSHNNSSSNSSSSNRRSNSCSSDDKDEIALAAISAIHINSVALKRETKRARARYNRNRIC